MHGKPKVHSIVVQLSTRAVEAKNASEYVMLPRSLSVSIPAESQVTRNMDSPIEPLYGHVEAYVTRWLTGDELRNEVSAVIRSSWFGITVVLSLLPDDDSALRLTSLAHQLLDELRDHLNSAHYAAASDEPPEGR